MKILFFLLLICSSCVFAQIENFSASNRNLYWQKVYNTDLSYTDIKKTISEVPKLKVLDVGDDYISGEIIEYLMDYKGAGYTFMGTAMVLNESNKFFSKFKLEYKEGRYRVMVSDIKSKGTQMSLFSSGLGLTDNGMTSVEEMALKNGKDEFREAFKKQPAKIINYTLDRIFDLKLYNNIKNDNW